MERCDGRKNDQLRKVWFQKGYLSNPLASVLIEMGNTRVCCSVTLEPGVPNWMRAQKVAGGWLTCEYGMLPASTHNRMRRESTAGKPSGRTLEIQRLIGRSLRAVVDLEKLGSNTIYIDCDVINADGGTRCASITGASVALSMAMHRLSRKLGCNPLKEKIAAVSVGMFKGEAVLDLNYEEDSNAEVDMNVVMTESGKFIEIQGTAEENPFSYEEMEQMLSLAKSGCETLLDLQNKLFTSKSNGDNKKHSNNKNKNLRKDPLGSIGDAFADLEL
ncbi:ribonuclease PH [Lentisphaerota bacterium WC36G]